MPEPDMPGNADLARLEQERRLAGEVDAARSTAPGRLTPRQRVDSLLDRGSFLELGALASSQQPTAGGPTPGDGVLTGFGRAGGRPVAVISEDPLVLARTDGQVAKSKRRRLLKLAIQQDLPIVFLADGPAGDVPAFPASAGELFGGLAEQQDDADVGRRRALLVGVVFGPLSGQAGEVVMEADVVVRAGGGGVAVVADVEAAVDAEALSVAADLLSLAAGPYSPHGVEAEAAAPGRLEGVPAPGAIAAGLADGGTWLPFARDAGSGLEGGLMRLGGVPVVMAVTGACGCRQLVPSDIHRLRRLVAVSGRLSAPLVLVQDCDGYSPDIMGNAGTTAEIVGLISDLRSLTPPITCLVAGAGHVLGTYCMGGRQVGPAAVLAWPWARIGVVDTPGYQAATLGPHRQPGPWLAAGMGLVDDVITPEETGPWLRWFARLWHDRRHIAPAPSGPRWYARSSIKGT